MTTTTTITTIAFSKGNVDEGEDDRPRQNPTHLPEILILMGRHLSQDDLTSCIRVSQSWNYYLEPFLWSNVSILPSSSPYHHRHRGYESSILKNIRQLYSLNVEHVQSPFFVQQLTPLLQNQLSSFSAEEYNSTVRQVLQQNAMSLKSLSCRNMTSRQRQHLSLPQPAQEATEFWKTLTTMPLLTELVLSGACVYNTDLPTFFALCERLTSLSLDNGSVSNLSPPNLVWFQTLKRLNLHRVSVGALRELKFISQCPNLEHLAWRPLESTPLNPFMFHLVTLPQDRIGLITSLDVSHTDLFDKQMATILSSGLRLSRLIAVHTPFGDFCADQVVCSMAETLEELDVRQCHHLVQSPMIQIMLMACKRLRRFRADEISVKDMDKSTFISHAWPSVRFTRPANSITPITSSSPITSMPNTNTGPAAPLSISSSSSMKKLSMVVQGEWQWACVDLEELELTFVGSQHQQHVLLNDLSLVYSQLAQLTELRRLVFGWRWKDVGVSSNGSNATLLHRPPDSGIPLKGSPPHLQNGSSLVRESLNVRAGLKRLWKLTQLRVFAVQGVDRPDFNVGDVRWMGKRWRGLRRVEGRLSTDPETELAIQEVLRTQFPHITQHLHK